MVSTPEVSDSHSQDKLPEPSDRVRVTQSQGSDPPGEDGGRMDGEVHHAECGEKRQRASLMPQVRDQLTRRSGKQR